MISVIKIYHFFKNPNNFLFLMTFLKASCPLHDQFYLNILLHAFYEYMKMI